MWELIGGLIIGITAATLKDVFIKGRNSATLRAHTEDIEDLGAEVKEIKKMVFELQRFKIIQEQITLDVIKDYNKIEETVKEFNNNLAANNITLAKLEQTLEKNNSLLDRLLDGDLRINKKRA